MLCRDARRASLLPDYFPVFLPPFQHCFNLAILENGQYNKDWRYIHMLPDQIIQAFRELKAERLFTVHHSKFALGYHPWDEPLKNITEAAERDSIPLLAPMIGEVVSYRGDLLPIKKWWEGIN